MFLKNKLAFITFPRSGKGALVRALFRGYHQEIKHCDLNEANAMAIFGNEVPSICEQHDWRADLYFPSRSVVCMGRDPLESFASWFDMNLRVGGPYKDTREEFERLVFNRFVPHWRRYMRKYGWRSSAEQPVTWVRYRELIESPEVAISRVTCLNSDIPFDMDAALDKGQDKIRVRHTYKGWRYYDYPTVTRIKAALGDTLLAAAALGLI